MLLVVGSTNSSNSNRLRETGQHRGLPAYLIDNADVMELSWFTDKSTVGISAGASAPEVLVQDVVRRLEENFNVEIEKMDGPREMMKFKLPPLPDYRNRKADA